MSNWCKGFFSGCEVKFRPTLVQCVHLFICAVWVMDLHVKEEEATPALSLKTIFLFVFVCADVTHKAYSYIWVIWPVSHSFVSLELYYCISLSSIHLPLLKRSCMQFYNPFNKYNNSIIILYYHVALYYRITLQWGAFTSTTDQTWPQACFISSGKWSELQHSWSWNQILFRSCFVVREFGATAFQHNDIHQMPVTL